MRTNFSKWLRIASRGSRCIYYRGSLLHDGVNPATGTEIGDRARYAPAAIEAWLAYERGDVRLYQRRLGPYSYQYIAVKQ